MTRKSAQVHPVFPKRVVITGRIPHSNKDLQQRASGKPAAQGDDRSSLARKVPDQRRCLKHDRII
jgi:hypothetical protein